MDQQEQLWHDTLADALRAAIHDLGGDKRVAGEMWRTRSPRDGAAYLQKCLNDERAEKLGLDEIVWILRRARESDSHVAMNFLAAACGYAPPEPIKPADECAELQRQFIESQAEMSRILKRLERLGMK